METTRKPEDALRRDGRVQRGARDRELVRGGLPPRTRPQRAFVPEMLETADEIAEAPELPTPFEVRDRLRGAQRPGRERAQRVLEEVAPRLLEGSRT